MFLARQQATLITHSFVIVIRPTHTTHSSREASHAARVGLAEPERCGTVSSDSRYVGRPRVWLLSACRGMLESASPPHLFYPLPNHPPTTATLGGLRTMRQGRRGGDRDVQEFLEEAVTPRGQFGAGAAGAGAGRGSGSYERFIKAHKETVLTEEDKRFKTWSSWKDQLEDFEDDGQE